MTPSDFEKLISSAINALPQQLREAMDNVTIVIESQERPAMRREVKIDRKGILLGLYQGVPKNQWGRSESGVLPDKITIFQEAIESLAKDEKSLRALVKDVVWHEIGHHFGFDDAELHRMARRRKKQS